MNLQGRHNLHFHKLTSETAGGTFSLEDSKFMNEWHQAERQVANPRKELIS